LIRSARRLASVAKHEVFPTPEVAAWRKACRAVDRTPRHTPGTIEMMGYRLRYSDLLTLCPQWHDIFIARSLAFAPTTDAPRILDCGANIGLASLFFKRIAPRARITAFEPDPALHQMLVDNLRSNGASDVEAVAAAVWTRPGTVVFRADGADSGAVDPCAHGVAGSAMTVPSVRLADLLTEPIDLLKLDIESAEGDVLEDSRGALANVRALLLDLHEFEAQRRQAPRVLRTLSESGFTYAVSNFTVLPWREPVGPSDGAFPNQPLCWTMAVRAWRDRQ